MDIDRCVAILAGHSFLVVDVLLHGDVVLGMQRGSRTAIGIVGRFVGRFHQALKRHANPLATVMARRAGLDRHAMVTNIMHRDRGSAGALDRVNERMAGSVVCNGCIVTFVEAFVAIGNVARRTSHAAKIPASLPALNRVVATLAFLPNVSVGGQRGVVFQPS